MKPITTQHQRIDTYSGLEAILIVPYRTTRRGERVTLYRLSGQKSGWSISPRFRTIEAAEAAAARWSV